MSGSIAHATHPLNRQATVSGPAALATALTVAFGVLRGATFMVCEMRDRRA